MVTILVAIRFIKRDRIFTKKSVVKYQIVKLIYQK